jgi:hypothetical protein
VPRRGAPWQCCQLLPTFRAMAGASSPNELGEPEDSVHDLKLGIALQPRVQSPLGARLKTLILPVGCGSKSFQCRRKTTL